MRHTSQIYLSPFGSSMSERVIGNYRYGFNGKETDSETGLQDYGFRIYNPSLGKFLSVDPLTNDYPWYTPYQFAGNMPIWAIDLDGLEPAYAPRFNYNPYDPWYKTTGKVIGNIGFSFYNGGIYAFDIVLNDFGRSGPSGVYNRLNDDLNGVSLAIANDMIHANKVEGINNGRDYLYNRIQSPETIEAILSFWVTKKIETPVVKIPSTRMTVKKGMSLAERIETRKSFVQNKFKSAVDKYGIDHIDYSKPVKTVNNNGSLINDRRLVQYRDPSNPNASPFFTYEGVDPSTLGIPNTYTQKYLVTLPENQTFNFLESTANKVEAYFPNIDPGIKGHYNGGGIQLYCPEAAKSATFTPVP